jgi:glycosyltransferase involved in cell wall biosynthesis
MDLSVIICTRNRAKALARALDSLKQAAVPPGLLWEVLVIDNGSSDETGAVAESFADALPLRVAHEPKPGLSRARNRAVAEARGRYLLWTDDDVRVDRTWLEAYWAAFQRHPDGAVFGGKILPVLEEPVTPWFRAYAKRLQAVLAHRDPGTDPSPLTLGGELPYGANYAVRAAEQRTRLYDPELGVTPDHHRSGEETAVITALLTAGHRGYWAPDAMVSHLIGPERQAEDYVLSYYAGQGETWVLETQGRDVRTRLWHQARRATSYSAYRLLRPLPGGLWIGCLRSYAFHSGILNMIGAKRPEAAAHQARLEDSLSEG